MSVIEAIIQGIVQGLTEFLPVSSSGHLTIVQHFFGKGESNLFFDVMLHLGTLVAVCVFYRKLIWRLIKELFSTIGDIFKGKFSWKNMSHDRRMLIMVIIALLPLFLLFLPIPGTDMQLKDLADLFTLPKYFIVVGISLLATSILLFIGDRCSKKTKNPKDNFTIGDSIIVGLVQCCAAIFSGLSRSGSTLSVAQMRKVDREKAFDYTFIMSIPSIIAAALLEFVELKKEGTENVEILPVVVGIISACVVGYLALILFKWLLKTNKMIIFIIYTAVVGIFVIVISILEMTNVAGVTSLVNLSI